MKYRSNHDGCHGGSILLGVVIGWTILLDGSPLQVARSQPSASASPGREKPAGTVQSADRSGTQETRLLDPIDSRQAEERTSFQTGAPIRIYGEFCDNDLARFDPMPKDWFEVWEGTRS